MAITKAERRNPRIDEEWPKLYEAIGHAIAEWSRLEHALASAFALTLNISDEVAEPVFFSARAFAGKQDMLRAAINSQKLDKTHPRYLRQKVFKSACKKAEKWASDRNKLAHEKSTITTFGDKIIGGVLVPNVLNDDIDIHLSQCITTNAIKEAASNFESLTQLILEACEPDEDTSLETLLLQVRSLARSPYSDSLERHVTSKQAPPP